ncbi:MAG: succinylglutamate desuccinylase/aspartoacylase family protein [Acidobacteria bacterium]|nr:succinylglutamate desuccinylase/aspartoacylase family protein [Acidobacteriota bacterium]MBU1473686.1 succinylglutamate desuccinylase/aspartoacylase family protein [Acidobacteriota bacterium]MBU2438578.1 succinylglutamate desuccinylase/aspartoacylase family protein [Acidobacteriota bacterium]
MNRHTILKAANALLLAGVLSVTWFAGRAFHRMHVDDPIYPTPGLTEKILLSRYHSALRSGPADTEIYLFSGKEKGGRLLVLGGTHPNEPAGFLAAVLMVENLQVEKGDVWIIPRANRSGFTHNDPQEASPQRFVLTTAKGDRSFRFGSRLTNPVHQWPDPILHINPAGQVLSGSDSRNLNRAYPGKKEGVLTERTAFAIMELIRTEGIDLALDLHEAAPEYPVINAMVFHENSAELAAVALMDLQLQNMDFRLEESPPSLRGLSHREWGDHSEAASILLESANVSHGRLKGKTSASLIVEGRDKNYVRAAARGLLFVPFDEAGIPLKERVARHLAAVRSLTAGLGDMHPDREIILHRFPSPELVREKGAEACLAPPNQR